MKQSNKVLNLLLFSTTYFIFIYLLTMVTGGIEGGAWQIKTGWLFNFSETLSRYKLLLWTLIKEVIKQQTLSVSYKFEI